MKCKLSGIKLTESQYENCNERKKVKKYLTHYEGIKCSGKAKRLEIP